MPTLDSDKYSAAVRSKAVVLLLLTLFIVTPIMGVCNCSMFCCTLPYVQSSFAINLMGKRELVALLTLSSWCLVVVVWLFLAVTWICLRFVIVIFPDHTHLLFLFVSKFLIFSNDSPYLQFQFVYSPRKDYSKNIHGMIPVIIDVVMKRYYV